MMIQYHSGSRLFDFGSAVAVSEPFRVLLNAYPAAASIPDASGQLAQTLAVRNGCCRAVLLMLMLASERVGRPFCYCDALTLSLSPCRRRHHTAAVGGGVTLALL